MLPEVANVHLTTYAELAEVDGHGGGVLVAVEQADNPVAVLHLSVPHLIVLAKLVAQGLTHKTVGIESEQFAVGIELKVVAYRSRLVGNGHRATGEELQRHDCLTLVVVVEGVETQEIADRIISDVKAKRHAKR